MLSGPPKYQVLGKEKRALSASVEVGSGLEWFGFGFLGFLRDVIAFFCALAAVNLPVLRKG